MMCFLRQIFVLLLSVSLLPFPLSAKVVSARLVSPAVTQAFSRQAFAMPEATDLGGLGGRAHQWLGREGWVLKRGRRIAITAQSLQWRMDSFWNRHPLAQTILLLVASAPFGGALTAILLSHDEFSSGPARNLINQLLRSPQRLPMYEVSLALQNMSPNDRLEFFIFLYWLDDWPELPFFLHRIIEGTDEASRQVGRYWIDTRELGSALIRPALTGVLGQLSTSELPTSPFPTSGLETYSFKNWAATMQPAPMAFAFERELNGQRDAPSQRQRFYSQQTQWANLKYGLRLIFELHEKIARVQGQSFEDNKRIRLLNEIFVSERTLQSALDHDLKDRTGILAAAELDRVMPVQIQYVEALQNLYPRLPFDYRESALRQIERLQKSLKENQSRRSNLKADALEVLVSPDERRMVVEYKRRIREVMGLLAHSGITLYQKELESFVHDDEPSLTTLWQIEGYLERRNDTWLEEIARERTDPVYLSKRDAALEPLPDFLIPLEVARNEFGRLLKNVKKMRADLAPPPPPTSQKNDEAASDDESLSETNQAILLRDVFASLRITYPEPIPRNRLLTFLPPGAHRIDPLEVESALDILVNTLSIADKVIGPFDKGIVLKTEVIHAADTIFQILLEMQPLSPPTGGVPTVVLQFFSERIKRHLDRESARRRPRISATSVEFRIAIPREALAKGTQLGADERFAIRAMQGLTPAQLIFFLKAVEIIIPETKFQLFVDVDPARAIGLDDPIPVGVPLRLFPNIFDGANDGRPARTARQRAYDPQVLQLLALVSKWPLDANSQTKLAHELQALRVAQKYFFAEMIWLLEFPAYSRFFRDILLSHDPQMELFRGALTAALAQDTSGDLAYCLLQVFRRMDEVQLQEMVEIAAGSPHQSYWGKLLPLLDQASLWKMEEDSNGLDPSQLSRRKELLFRLPQESHIFQRGRPEEYLGINGLLFILDQASSLRPSRTPRIIEQLKKVTKICEGDYNSRFPIIKLQALDALIRMALAIERWRVAGGRLSARENGSVKLAEMRDRLIAAQRQRLISEKPFSDSLSFKLYPVLDEIWQTLRSLNETGLMPLMRSEAAFGPNLRFESDAVMAAYLNWVRQEIRWALGDARQPMRPVLEKACRMIEDLHFRVGRKLDQDVLERRLKEAASRPLAIAA